jgi:hypothetical protein
LHILGYANRASELGRCLGVGKGCICAFAVLATGLYVRCHHTVTAWLEDVQESIADTWFHELRSVVSRRLAR